MTTGRTTQTLRSNTVSKQALTWQTERISAMQGMSAQQTAGTAPCMISSLLAIRQQSTFWSAPNLDTSPLLLYIGSWRDCGLRVSVHFLSSALTNVWWFTHLKSNFKILLLSLTRMLWGQVVLINNSWGTHQGLTLPPIPGPALRRIVANTNEIRLKWCNVSWRVHDGVCSLMNCSTLLLLNADTSFMLLAAWATAQMDLFSFVSDTTGMGPHNPPSSTAQACQPAAENLPVCLVLLGTQVGPGEDERWRQVDERRVGGGGGGGQVGRGQCWKGGEQTTQERRWTDEERRGS